EATKWALCIAERHLTSWREDCSANESTTMHRVAILINPAAGKERPVLAPINRALTKAGIEWDAYILKPDAETDAVARAVRARPDALWVYGVDGTISRVASALVH